MGRGNVFGKILPVFFAALLVAGCSREISGLRPLHSTTENVSSLRPTFRWEIFPRPKDLEGDNAALKGRIRNVTYEMKIWKLPKGEPVKMPTSSLNSFPGLQLVYHRRGLPEPRHQVEQPLEPSTKYTRTILARYELDDHLQVIQWTDYKTRPSGSPPFLTFQTPSE